jgi:hypothetical protein
MTGWVAALTVVVMLEALMIVGLLRSHGEMLRRLRALDGGAEPDARTPVDFRVRDDLPVPGAGTTRVTDVAGQGIVDDVVLVRVTGVEHRTLLAFLSSGCLTCHGFWEAFRSRASLDLAPDVRVVVVAKDRGDESMSTLRGLAPSHLPVVLSSAAWSDYAVPGAPYFVFVDGPTSAILGEGTGSSWDQVRSLLTTAAADDGDGEARNEARIDRELLAAGIHPGDASLYHPASEPAEPTERDVDS